MSLLKLMTLVPAPESPVWTGCDEDWNLIEDELGTKLPGDYRELIHTYGYGDFCATFSILSPFAGSRGLKQTHVSRETYFRTMLSSYGNAKFCVYPDDGGILYVGGDEYTNSLTWLTKGPADKWPLIDDHMCKNETFAMPLTTFLLEWATGNIKPLLHDKLFDKPPLQRSPLFKPAPIHRL